MSHLRERFPTFGELVDYCAGLLLQKLIAGEFRTGVYQVLVLAIDWSKEGDE